MGQFTRLTAKQAAEIAGVFALGAPEALAPIDAGTINSNFRLATAAGAWFVRVNEGKREDEVAYEADLVAWIAARGVPTPSPVAAADGRRWARVGGAGLVTVFPWVEGVHASSSRATAAQAAAAGRALAQLHAAARGFVRRREHRYAFAEIARRHEGLSADCCDPALVRAVADVGEELAWLAERAGARAALPAGVVHGDLFPDNVLFDGERLVALLDFEQASDGAFAYDLAVSLCAWCYADDFVPERARALRAGYEEVRPLEPAERELLWVEARAAATRFTVTRLTDVYLNAAATPLVRATKDFRRYHARLRRLRQLGAAGFAELVGWR